MIELDTAGIAAFCRTWNIRELSLFGSVLRDDFRPDSDVDVLVTFGESADWSLMDLITMRDGLAILFGHEVDLIERRALRNPFRRHEILSHHEVIYAA